MLEDSSGGAASATSDKVTTDLTNVNKPAYAKIVEQLRSILGHLSKTGDGHQFGANESMSNIIGDS